MVPSGVSFVPGKLLRATKADFFCHRVYASADGGTIWQYERMKNNEVILSYHVSPEWDRISLLADNSRTDGSLAFEYLGQMLPSVLLPFHVLSFHGVLMESNRKGIILSAASGVGKTTHARLWRDLSDALILNGDRTICRETDGIWTGFGMPWCGSSGEHINRCVPVSAIVALEQGSENRAELLNGPEALGAVMPHLLYPGWDLELSGITFDLLSDLLGAVPVIRLFCTPDKRAVCTLKAALKKL